MPKCVKCENTFAASTLRKYDGSRCKRCYDTQQAKLEEMRKNQDLFKPQAVYIRDEYKN